MEKYIYAIYEKEYNLIEAVRTYRFAPTSIIISINLLKKMTEIVAVIPARGGSKSIPRKNIIHLSGKPLVFYSIKAGLESQYISEVFVSTEDSEIAYISASFGAKIIDRPTELADDNTSTFDVIKHAEKVLHSPDVIVVLQPTSPLRSAKEIDEAIELLDPKTDAVIGVCETKQYRWTKHGSFAYPRFSNRLPRHQMQKEYYENGAIYITRSVTYRNNDFILGMGIPSKGNIKLYKMSAKFGIDIDTKMDLKLTEFIMQSENTL